MSSASSPKVLKNLPMYAAPPVLQSQLYKMHCMATRGQIHKVIATLAQRVSACRTMYGVHGLLDNDLALLLKCSARLSTRHASRNRNIGAGAQATVKTAVLVARRFLVRYRNSTYFSQTKLEKAESALRAAEHELKLITVIKILQNDKSEDEREMA